MKKILIAVAFLATLVLGLAVTNSFGQKEAPTNNAFNCFECCPLGVWTAQVRGRLVGFDTYSQRQVRSSSVNISVYEYRQNLSRVIRPNIFGYFATTVDACETIVVQPFLTSRLVNTHYMYSDPSSIFRDLYFNPAPDDVLEQDFTLEIVPMPTLKR